jgi:hypothetical protein
MAEVRKMQEQFFRRSRHSYIHVQHRVSLKKDPASRQGLSIKSAYAVRDT